MSLLLKHGKIITMEEKDYELGDLLIVGNKIRRISSEINIENLNEDELVDLEILDVRNCTIIPGFIEAHCHIGITEERKGIVGDDCNETTNPVTPHLRGLDAINPLDAAFSKAVKAGITSVMVGPGSSNVVGGQFVFMKTAGSRCIDHLIMLSPAAMKASFGENPKTLYGKKDIMPCSRMGIAAMLREELSYAEEYYYNIRYAKENGTTPPHFHFRLASWIPVFENRIPLKCHVHRADDIFTAIRIAEEFNIKITLDHCTEGHLIAAEIKQSGFPAIVGPDFTSRNKIETENMAFKTAGILNRAGILTAITTDHPVSLIQYLPLCAGMAVKNGLNKRDGLRCITSNAAKICGVFNRVGSIAVGKDADIAIFDGEPLGLFNHCLATIINGQIVFSNFKDNSFASSH